MAFNEVEVNSRFKGLQIYPRSPRWKQIPELQNDLEASAYCLHQTWQGYQQILWLQPSVSSQEAVCHSKPLMVRERSRAQGGFGWSAELCHGFKSTTGVNYSARSDSGVEFLWRQESTYYIIKIPVKLYQSHGSALFMCVITCKP